MQEIRSFSNNQMKGNPNKCHLLTSATASIAIKIKENKILNSEREKLLGVTIDNKLNFNNHLQKILQKANQKIHVLARITPYMARITPYMSIPKRMLLMNSFFISQFNYCPLMWMCHSRLSNLGPRIWNLVPSTLKKLDDVNSFKTLIKKWQPKNCPCRLCKTYIPHVGFI